MLYSPSNYLRHGPSRLPSIAIPFIPSSLTLSLLGYECGVCRFLGNHIDDDRGVGLDNDSLVLIKTFHVGFVFALMSKYYYWYSFVFLGILPVCSIIYITNRFSTLLL